MIDQTPNPDPEKSKQPEDDQRREEESPLSDESLPQRQSAASDPVPTYRERLAALAEDPVLKRIADEARKVRESVDQANAPEVDPVLIARYAAGELDDEQRRYAVQMTLRYTTWDQAYFKELLRLMAQDN